MWSVQLAGSSVAVADGFDLLLAPSEHLGLAGAQPSSEIALLDAKTGNRRWSFTLDATTRAADSVLTPHGIVLLLTTTPHSEPALPKTTVAMFDRETGARRWEQPLESYGIMDAPDPLAYNSLSNPAEVLVLTHAPSLVAQAGGASPGATTISIDPSTGSELWRLPTTLRLGGGATTRTRKAVLIARRHSRNGRSTEPEVAIDGSTGKVR